MNRFVLTVVSIISLVSLFGCGVGWQSALSTEEMSKYPNVITLAKDRYTNVRASSSLSHWQQSEAPGRSVASFIIVTNTIRVNPDKRTFFNDMSGYCQLKNGTFKDIRAENRARMAELRKKYSYQEESRSFECGPEGRGTISQDWTKFNPAVCRKLYDTKVKTAEVTSEYGKPADYQCEINDGILYMLTMREQYERNKAVSVFIRINEANGEPITGKKGRIDMQ